MFQHIFCLFLSRAVTDFKGCQLLSCESKWDVKNRHKNTAARLSAAESTLDIIDLRALNQQRLDGIMPAQSFWWAIVDCCFWLCLCQYSTYYSCIIMHQSKVCRSVLFFYSKPKKKNGFLHQTVVSLFGFLCFHFFFFFLNSDLLFVPFTCIVTISCTMTHSHQLVCRFPSYKLINRNQELLNKTEPLGLLFCSRCCLRPGTGRLRHVDEWQCLEKRGKVAAKWPLC